LGGTVRGDLNATPVWSDFGVVQLLWHIANGRPSVVYVRLPNEIVPAASWIGEAFVAVGHEACPAISELCELLERFLRGEPATFDLGVLALDLCTPFQRRVLLAEARIPRGAVSTYGRVARAVGEPSAARAVGQALGRNPFPIMIPCHRAIRADGHVGGYRGGVDLKRGLLRLEGVEVTPEGRVVARSYYY
jgi:methylated-DNA-[protein]-cysteine S-methyltransferase